MLISKRTGDRTQPGPWWWPTVHQGKRSATVRCPDCGTVVVLENHLIARTGDVSPSVVCPTDGCKFHVMVFLDGW